MNKYNFSGSTRGKLRTLDAKLYMHIMLVQTAKAELEEHFKSIRREPKKLAEQIVLNESFTYLDDLQEGLEHARQMLAGALTHGRRMQIVKNQKA